jgi:RES domain-containing protein
MDELMMDMSADFACKDTTAEQIFTPFGDQYVRTPPSINTQKMGDGFIDSLEACILKVPSAVVQGDFNYLINPHHKEFKKIEILEVHDSPLDKRIFQ